MDNFLWIVLGGIVGIGILIAISKALCIYVRKPLVEFCNERGLSASPWLTLIIIGIGVYLLNEHLTLMNVEQSMSSLLPNYSYAKSSTRQIYEYGGIALISLPLLILLIRAKKYFIPVLLIKIICVPLDILYALHGSDKFIDARPLSGAAYHTNGAAYAGKGGRYYDDSGQQAGYIDGDRPAADGYVEEKYQDQHRVRQEADSYHTVSTESGEHYYSGDYVPFVSTGEVTEIRTYDSDTAPME